jgi:hypothetical protein
MRWSKSGAEKTEETSGAKRAISRFAFLPVKTDAVDASGSPVTVFFERYVKLQMFSAKEGSAPTLGYTYTITHWETMHIYPYDDPHIDEWF